MCLSYGRSGKGLGKNEDGMTEALKTKRKDDNAGVRACVEGTELCQRRPRRLRLAF
jgi:hypothetical protein